MSDERTYKERVQASAQASLFFQGLYEDLQERRAAGITTGQAYREEKAKLMESWDSTMDANAPMKAFPAFADTYTDVMEEDE